MSVTVLQVRSRAAQRIAYFLQQWHGPIAARVVIGRHCYGGARQWDLWRLSALRFLINAAERVAYRFVEMPKFDRDFSALKRQMRGLW